MSKVFFFLGTATLVLNGVRPLGNVTVSDLFYFAALFFLVLEGIRGKKKPRDWMPLHKFWLPACLILVGGLLSSINAAQPGTSVSVTLKAWFLFSLWIGMGIAMVRGKGQGKNVLMAFLIGAAFTSSVAVWDFLTGMQVGPALYGPDSAVTGFFPRLYIQSSGRYSGTFGHPNHLGELTAVAIPIALDLALSASANKRQKWRSLVLGVMTLIIIWANILTGSIAALVGAALAVMVLVAVRSATSRHLLATIRQAIVVAGIGLMLCILVISTILNNAVLGWIATNVDRVATNTGPGRLSLLQEAWGEIAANPWLGYGMDQGSGDLNPNLLVTTFGVHNTVFQSWLAGGLITLVGVVLAYWESLRLVMRSLRTYVKQGGVPYISGLAASIVGWIFFDMTQPSIYLRYTWITVAILYGLIGLKRDSATQATLTPSGSAR